MTKNTPDFEPSENQSAGQPEEDGGYFGVCPQCGRQDGYLNVDRNHYFVCHQHKTKWCAGSNLFSSWRHESAADFQANTDLLQDYQEVEPHYPTVI